MAAGPMRRRITFQEESQTPDGGGGYELAWSDIVTVWGSFQPERGRERIEAGRLAETLGGVIKIRSSAASRAITPGNRAVMSGVSYNIRSISNPDQRNKFLEMTVERGGVAT